MSTVTAPDGTVVDYDRYGEGPAVIFVGGATQHRAIDPGTTTSARQLAELGFTTIDYDRRGRDRSTDTQPWSIDREAEDLAALIEAAGGRAGVYTSSSGAAVALAAVTAGAGISALALYEPPFFAGLDNAEHVRRLRELVAQGRLAEALRYNLTAIIGVPAEVVDGMAQTPMWPGMVAVAPTLPYDIGSSHDINVDQDWPARWAKVTVPTVVLSGDQTFPGMPAAADSVAAALPNARREILAGQGHGPTPEALVPVLATIFGAR